MLNLIKYEFLAKSRRLLIFLAAALGINAALLIRFALAAEENPLLDAGLLSIFFTLLFFGFMVLLFIDVILTYSRDLNSKEGYMFFLTPNSSYKILGAKVLTGILEGLLFVAIYVGLAAVNFFGFYRETSLSIWRDAWLVFMQIPAPEYTNAILAFVLTLLNMFVAVMILVLIAYAAMTIRRGLLAEIKFGGLFSFGIFVVLNGITFWITDKVGYLASQGFNFERIGEAQDLDVFLGQFILGMLIGLGTQLLIGGIYFWGTGYLLEKRVNL